MDRNCGIYKIENTKNGKVYIGSSKRLNGRKYDHFYNLENKKHGNKYLQNSFNKHGEDNFKFEVLMYCSEDNLEFYEQKAMDEYNACNSKYGYNSSNNPKRPPIQRGENHPDWKGGKIEVECENCGASYKVYPSRAERGDNFCSNFCHSDWMIKEKVVLTCNHCGKNYKVIPSYADKSKFCSCSCKDFTENQGSSNGMAKLTENNVKQIKKILQNTDRTYKSIGNQFDVCHSLIGRINRGESWSHVNV